MLDIETVRNFKNSCRHDRKWYKRVVNFGQLAALICFLSTVVIYWADIWLYANADFSGNLLSAVLPGGCIAHLYFRFVWNIASILEDERILILAFSGVVVVLSLHIRFYVQVLGDDDFFSFMILMFLESIASYIAIFVIPPEEWEAPYALLLLGVTIRIAITFALLIAQKCARREKWLRYAEMLLWSADQNGWADTFVLSELTEEDLERLEEDYRKHGEEGDNDDER